MDVWKYFHQRERECGELSLVPDSDFASMCAEAEWSDGTRGILFGRFTLTERTFLSVYEVIQVKGTGVHRERYSYYLIVDEEEAWGFDRDPDHSPSLHRHEGRNHERYPCRRMTFREVVQKAWETVSVLEGADPVPDDRASDY